MTNNISAFRPLLQQGDFGKLFNELGWDRLKTGLTVAVGPDRYALAPVAEKRGVQIFQCLAPEGGKIPPYAVRRKIEAEVTKSAYNHVLIFTDAQKTTQLWQWVAREAGKPLAYREQTYHRGQSGEALLQKLDHISFSLPEEERLTLSGVTFKLKDAFDKDKVTKKFYERFQKEHEAFLDFVQHIPDAEFQRWYASVMINRLMFLYFIQAKGFLNSDPGYLQTKLKQSHGHFYRDFLCPLFFEGFAQRHHSPETTLKLGKVPYLNGGLFAKHQIEDKYGAAITIPDSAFQKLFSFFDDYNWLLDDRPLKNDKEINPDVLGYIFEKYINQKQMGAYYTKEDITEYIGKNTILPFLLDRAREDCQVAFEGEGGLWRLLREAPDRYLYPAVRHGTALPLPDFIAQGLENVAARGEWNKPAPSEFGLPTEIWREVVARRQRCAEVRGKLASGTVRDVADLITYNLDIRQFAQDCIENGGSDFLLAVWNVLNGTPEGRLPMSVLDPTCGSGAFLFAALEILDPLYEACLDRMNSFVSDADLLAQVKAPSGPPPHADSSLSGSALSGSPRIGGGGGFLAHFRAILTGAAGHADRRYFVLKSIIVNNLFGVDIMEEATEICKLRLFLTLAAQVAADPAQENFGIEPLPDIDFNIRAGNTLVGFATEAQTEKAVRGRLDFDNSWPRIQARAAAAAKLFEGFQKSQNDTTADPAFVAGMKQGLREGLKPLREELDTYLGQQYGKIGKESLAAWKKTAQPFHWFIEFYRVMKTGGFDVIIGNPPYVEYSEVKKQYQIKGYTTEPCGNLYAFAIERCFTLAQKNGRMGLIVPVSSVSTDGYSTLQIFLKTRDLHYSSYDDRPSRLFDGLEHIRLTIHIIGQIKIEPKFFSTRYNKWSSIERETLLQRLQFTSAQDTLIDGSMPKFTASIEASINTKIKDQAQRLALFYARNGNYKVLYSRKVGYFLQVLNFQPKVIDGHGNLRPPSEFKEIKVENEAQERVALCSLNSNLFYWFVTVFSDCRHLNKREVDNLPIRLNDLALSQQGKKLCALSEKLMTDIEEKSEVRNMRFKHDTLKVQCIIPKKSKPIIDQIDRVLAQHYGFTAEETDFLINYDIKYRMGRGGEEAGEE